MRHATKYDLPVYGAIGSFWLGATRATRGDPTGGLRQMEPAFEPTHGIGQYASLPGVVMADTLARAGRDRDALALLARLLGEMSDAECGHLRLRAVAHPRRARRAGARRRCGAGGALLAGGVADRARARGDAPAIEGGDLACQAPR